MGILESIDWFHLRMSVERLKERKSEMGIFGWLIALILFEKATN